MTAREVYVSPSVIETLAQDHNLVVTFTATTAYCTHLGVTYCTPLPERVSR